MQEKEPFRFLRRRLRLSWMFGLAAALCLVLGTFPGRLSAQALTSTVTGSVADPTGAVIVGAKVTLTLTLTGSTRATTTNSRGNFVFDNVPPGTYEMRITQTGFNTYDRKGMQLAAGETLSLHKIALKVGATSTSVTVTGEAARVNTYNGNGSGLVNETQMSNIPDKGRNYMDYLQLLPGTEGTPGGTNAPGWGQGRITFNGGDSGTVLMLLNGVAVQDSGAPGAPAFTQPSVSSIAEERVHTGVESAKYGGRAGGTIDVVTKHGTSQFHGSLYYYNRNNFYNANDWFRKNNSSPAIADHPAPYKYNDFGGTIGGPILLPGLKYNSTRQRAFFFFSYEGIRRRHTGGLSNMTTPTPAERAGVFTNLTQDLVNPAGTSAQQPVCSGVTPNITCQFPSVAISPAGQKLLNVLPMPTCLRAGDSATGLNASLAGLPNCSSNNHNYSYVNSYPWPWHNDVLRTDFKLSNNELFYVVLQTNREEREGYTGFLGGSGQWPQSLTNYLIRSRDAMGSLVSTLSPTVVNSLTFGTNYAIQSDFATTPEALSSNNRAALGLGPAVLPVLFPDPSNGGAQSLHVNPYDLIPNVGFGGQTNQNTLVGGNDTPGAGTMPNAPSMRFESRYPFFGTDWDWTFSDNLSWVKGNQNMTYGIWYEHVSRSTATYSSEGGANFNGVLDFSSNGIFSATNASGSPFDTGNTFANVIAGAFNRYASDNTRWVSHGLNHDIAWFAQDDWQVVPHLTLDLGIRFTVLMPNHLRNGQLISEFQPQLYDAASQPGLILPCIPSSGANAGLRVGCESNGTQVPASTIGLYDPSTYSGNPPYSGMLTTTGYVYNMPKIQWGPRIGFAWDVFGNGKTALRGGFGIFYNRTGGVDDVLTKADNPPLILSPAIYNSTIPQMLANPSRQTFLGPQNVSGPVRIYKQPQVYDYRLGIEQNMTHGILLDVSYVGDQSRHFQRHNSYNGLPYGENFQSKYQDPTQPAGTPYIANIIRCMNPSLYCGYGGVNFSTFNENSNYNALQASVTKRFGSNFIGGLAYTWSKTLDYGGCCDVQTTPYLPGGARYWYGVPGQYRKQNLTINWHYNLPNAPFQDRFAKTALNGWSVEGIASFISGGPVTIGASYSGDPNGGGGPVGAIVASNVALVKSYKVSGNPNPFYLNPAAITGAPNGVGVCQLNQPALCGLGNTSPRDQFTGPGTNDWNVSLLKKFPLGNSETRYVQFRWETYNTFNHPQFSNPNSGAHFTSTGGVPANSTFGEITSLAVPARVMEFALGIHF